MATGRRPILNIGSLNSDHVYAVKNLVRAGETIASSQYQRHPGGKGANQSVALARAGAHVVHAGAVGPEGQWLVDILAQEGIDTRFIQSLEEPTGHAVIQVDEQGENAIFLYGGANQCLREKDIRDALNTFQPGDWILLQNETNALDFILEEAHGRKMRICLNPAPLDESIAGSPLSCVEILILNQSEGLALTGRHHPEAILESLQKRYQITEVVLTLGAEGVLQLTGDGFHQTPGVPLSARDTTGAGDTFIGHYLAARSGGSSPAQAVGQANRAAAICVTKAGAIPSIPRKSEIDSFFRKLESE